MAACCGSGVASAKAPPPQESLVKVELVLAAEHVASDLKAGTKVDLEQVTAKVGSGSFVDYKTKKILRELEVASVTKAEKPSDPEKAVTVVLKVTSDQAKQIEKLKTEQAPYEERKLGAAGTTVTKPVVFRLEEMTKVSVSFAAENVPAEVKAGSQVQLMRVTGRTMTATGNASETKSPVVSGLCEVLSVEQVEKPADPDQAVKVEFKVTKTMAARIEEAKAQKVTVVERAGGNVVRKQKTLPMHLELPKEEPKK